MSKVFFKRSEDKTLTLSTRPLREILRLNQLEGKLNDVALLNWGTTDKKEINRPVERASKAFLRKGTARFLRERTSARCLYRSFCVEKLSINCFVRRARRPIAIQDGRRHRAVRQEIHAKRRQAIRGYLDGGSERYDRSRDLE